MIRTEFDGFELTFETSPGLFSPTALDEGTAAMLRHASITLEDKVLDLGCGYGVVGVYTAHLTDPSRVWLVDVDPVAVELAQRNIRLNRVLKEPLLWAAPDHSGYRLDRAPRGSGQISVGEPVQNWSAHQCG